MTQLVVSSLVTCYVTIMLGCGGLWLIQYPLCTFIYLVFFFLTELCAVSCTSFKFFTYFEAI